MYGVLRETIDCARARLLLETKEESIPGLSTTGDDRSLRQHRVPNTMSLPSILAPLRADRHLLRSIPVGSVTFQQMRELPWAEALLAIPTIPESHTVLPTQSLRVTRRRREM